MLKRGDKRGLSTIVATLLIILLTLVAVGIIWVVIKNVITSGTEQISLGKLTLSLEIKSATVNIVGNTIIIKIKRNVGEGTISGLNFIVDDGDNTEVIESNLTLNELEERTVTFSLNGSGINISRIQKVSVAPIFLLESGKEIIGDVKDEYTLSTNSYKCTPNCAGLNCGADPVCGTSCGTCSTGYTCSVGTCYETSLLKANNATCLANYECLSGNCDYDVFSDNTVEGNINAGTNKYCHASASKCFFYSGYGDENNAGCTRGVAWFDGTSWISFTDTCGPNSEWENFVRCTGTATPYCSANSASGFCNVTCVQCANDGHCPSSTPHCINNICSA